MIPTKSVDGGNPNEVRGKSEKPRSVDKHPEGVTRLGYDHRSSEYPTYANLWLSSGTVRNCSSTTKWKISLVSLVCPRWQAYRQYVTQPPSVDGATGSIPVLATIHNSE